MDLLEYSLEEKIKKEAPLAYRMAPRNLDEFVGQRHLVGKGKPFRKCWKRELLLPLFLRPPGTGKTTLALLAAKITGSSMEKLNAVSAGVKDVRQVIKKLGKEGNLTAKTLCF